MAFASICLCASGAHACLVFGQVVINPTGGTGSTDGIRLTIGNTGQIQVLRNGTGQLYNPNLTAGATTNCSMTNGVFLAVGNTVTGPQNFATVASAGVTLQEWTPISNTFTPQGSGGTATTVLRATVAARNYDLTVTWQYTFPNDFVIVTHSLVVPAGNASTVRLYHVADAFLGGDDFGPSFFSLGPPALVGGYRPASNIVEAWRFRGGIAWTGYFAGFYACLFDASGLPGGPDQLGQRGDHLHQLRGAHHRRQLVRHHVELRRGARHVQLAERPDLLFVPAAALEEVRRHRADHGHVAPRSPSPSTTCPARCPRRTSASPTPSPRAW